MCDHSACIDDQHSGDVVCTSCGVVVTDHISFPTLSASNYSMNTRNDEKRLTYVENIVLREKIMNVCSQLHLDENSIFVDCVVNIYQNIFYKEFENNEEKSKKKKNLANSSEQDCLLAFAVWEALNRQGTPWSPHAIAQVFGIDSNQLLKAEKKYNFGSTYCGLVAIIETECQHLLIPFHIVDLIKQLAAEIEPLCYGRKPEIVIVSCILSILLKVQDEKLLETFPQNVLLTRYGVDKKSMKKFSNLIPSYDLYPLQNCNKYVIMFKK